ncbi:MAG: general secretion pathway protein GspE [Anaeromyxobacter sp.]
MTGQPKKRLGELLVEAGVIDESQLASALAYQRQWGVRLGQALVEMKFATEADVVEVLARRFSFEVARLDRLDGYAHQQALQLVGREFSLKHNVFPMQADTSTLTVAMSDPTNLQVVDELRFRTGRRVKVAIGGDREIAAAVKDAFPNADGGNVDAIALDLDADEGQGEAVMDPFGGGTEDAMHAFYGAPSSPVPIPPEFLAPFPAPLAQPGPLRGAPMPPVAPRPGMPGPVSPFAPPGAPPGGTASFPLPAAPAPAAPPPQAGPAQRPAPAPGPAPVAPRAAPPAGAAPQGGPVAGPPRPVMDPRLGQRPGGAPAGAPAAPPGAPGGPTASRTAPAPAPGRPPAPTAPPQQAARAPAAPAAPSPVTASIPPGPGPLVGGFERGGFAHPTDEHQHEELTPLEDELTPGPAPLPRPAPGAPAPAAPAPAASRPQAAPAAPMVSRAALDALAQLVGSSRGSAAQGPALALAGLARLLLRKGLVTEAELLAALRGE